MFSPMSHEFGSTDTPDSSESLRNSRAIRFNRRTALRWGAVGASTAAAGYGLSAATAQHGTPRQTPLEAYNQYTGAQLPFLHGVASGDPLPTSVVLWTRVTPDRDALPGSGMGDDVHVAWEIATDEAMGSVVAHGQEVALSLIHI